MSITVDFYKFSKKLNSTKQPQNASSSMNCTLKDVCSIESPILMVSVGSASAPDWNYCYISDFKRYYHIDNWTWVRGLWHASCSVDVLASYKTEVGNSSQYVTRAYSQFDTYVKDEAYPIVNKHSQTRIDIENLFPRTLSGGTFILGIVGDNTETLKLGSVSYYGMSEAMLKTFVQTLFLDDVWSELVRSYTNPIQYIVSCIWIPYDLSSTDFTTIKLGQYDLVPDGTSEGIQGYKLTYAQSVSIKLASNITLPKHPQEVRGKYLNASPFSYYTLYLPPFGKIALDTTKLVDVENIDLVMQVDIVSGRAVVHIFDGLTRLQSAYAQIGVPIELAQSTSFTVSDIAGLVGSTAGVVGNIALGNVGGAILGGANMISSLVTASQDKLSSAGSNGSLLAYADDSILICDFYEIAEENRDHIGRPLCKEKTINTLSGFVKVSDAELDLDIPMSELLAIQNYMEGGFFYE